jgi:type VI protein secretion system component Hcp
VEQTMSEQEKKQQTSITPQPVENKKESGELSEEELKKVAGGTTTVTPFSVTKYVDAASPKLYDAASKDG